MKRLIFTHIIGLHVHRIGPLEGLYLLKATDQIHGTEPFLEAKVAVSIPDEAIRLFNLPNPSRRTMALESTQPPTEMSTRNLSGG
jgi:hypothetical protein